MSRLPKVSIITPSFRNDRWLKLCVASVADQAVPHEHIVQDSCSDDGTQEWLPADPRVRAFIEKDRGMYDAVNRGLARAKGEILAYINCDEQYLPGALAKVVDYFETHPEVDVVFADTVVVNPDGEYLCHRQACLPLKYHSWVSFNLAILTCATFFRQSIVAKGLLFNANLRDVGDAEWIIRLIDNNVSMGLLKEFTSVFTETGTNMNLLPNAQREKQEMFAAAPAWVRRSRPLFVLHHRLRRFVCGHYRAKPFSYSLFTARSPDERVTVSVSKPTFRWVR